jgi:hypothetical protein
MWAQCPSCEKAGKDRGRDNLAIKKSDPRTVQMLGRMLERRHPRCLWSPHPLGDSDPAFDLSSQVGGLQNPPLRLPAHYPTSTAPFQKDNVYMVAFKSLA